ncbi:MAG: hypothetical protein AAGI03_08030 [Pseudomonadota bacterium]
MLTNLLKSIVVAVALVAGSATAKETVVAISPFGTPAAKLAEVKAVGMHLMTVLKPGETGRVIDAYSLRQVAEITISTDPDKSKTLRRRMRAAPEFFADTKRFADAAVMPEGENFLGQIDFPGLLRMVGSSYPAEQPRDLIIYGASPLTHDPRMPGLSMAAGAVPDDASIAASRSENVYGAAGEAALLKNYTVHWGTNGAGWATNDVHHFHV